MSIHWQPYKSNRASAQSLSVSVGRSSCINLSEWTHSPIHPPIYDIIPPFARCQHSLFSWQIMNKQKKKHPSKQTQPATYLFSLFWKCLIYSSWLSTSLLLVRHALCWCLQYCLSLSSQTLPPAGCIGKLHRQSARESWTPLSQTHSLQMYIFSL